MSGTMQLRAWLAGGVLLAVSAVAASAGDSQTSPATPTVPAQATPTVPAKSTAQHSHIAKKKTPPPPLVLPPLPPGPLQQVPLPQLPKSEPKVSFENGQLTIVANNATLGDILTQVKKLTGASIELPANGAPERVVTQIGPGAPRDVLATLLNGTAFNYVMLGSNSDPTAVLSVVLTPKPGGEQAEATGANYQQVPQPMAQRVPMPGQAFRQAAATPPQPEVAADEPDDTADQADPGDQEQATEQQEGNQPEQPNSNQPNAGPRTPEQLLQMMRQGQPGALNQPAQQPPQ